jgi:predicted nuclease of predicted toxin-antitoxin system
MGRRRPQAVRDPIMIDECLSPDLAAYAQARGYHATHVLHRGRRGAEDAALMPLILAENFIFVTANGRDFLKLYAREEVHPGLIIIVHGNGTARAQMSFFGKALDRAESLRDLTNLLLEVFEDGQVAVWTYPTFGT